MFPVIPRLVIQALDIFVYTKTRLSQYKTEICRVRIQNLCTNTVIILTALLVDFLGFRILPLREKVLFHSYGASDIGWRTGIGFCFCGSCSTSISS